MAHGAVVAVVELPDFPVEGFDLPGRGLEAQLGVLHLLPEAGDVQTLVTSRDGIGRGASLTRCRHRAESTEMKSKRSDPSVVLAAKVDRQRAHRERDCDREGGREEGGDTKGESCDTGDRRTIPVRSRAIVNVCGMGEAGSGGADGDAGKLPPSQSIFRAPTAGCMLFANGMGTVGRMTAFSSQSSESRWSESSSPLAELSGSSECLKGRGDMKGMG